MSRCHHHLLHYHLQALFLCPSIVHPPPVCSVGSVGVMSVMVVAIKRCNGTNTTPLQAMPGLTPISMPPFGKQATTHLGWHATYTQSLSPASFIVLVQIVQGHLIIFTKTHLRMDNGALPGNQSNEDLHISQPECCGVVEISVHTCPNPHSTSSRTFFTRFVLVRALPNRPERQK